MNKLVIVESPNKINTIQKYLGNDYVVVASYGHFLEMVSSGKDGLGIDFENWEPIYRLDSSKNKYILPIKQKIKEVDFIYIATDPDREGEAIGENLVNYFKIKNNKYKRIIYNEITKEAIINAIENPKDIDVNLVNSQKARRMLDRIIGFKTSKLLKNKIKSSGETLSAGRVQTVCLKIVVDRENEISNFVPIKYSLIDATIEDNIVAKYFNKNGSFENKEWIEREDSKKVYSELKGDLRVVDIKKSQKLDPKIVPLKLATVLKKSFLNNTKSTMSVLQKLYEGYGDSGLISYPRTDSTRYSNLFVKKANDYIEKKFGKEYIAKSIKSSKGDQDAHEAIRPTDIYLTPEMASKKYPSMKSNEIKIYSLIYNHTLRSLMSQPNRELIRYELSNNNHLFKINYSKIIFKGYTVIISEDDKNEEKLDPNLKKGDFIKVKKYNIYEKETNPPSRYTENSLIDKLDEIKVGRPSTFAEMVTKNIQRKYVEKNGSSLSPTNLGKLVLEKLLQGFEKQFSENYTATIELDLDDIAQGKVQYKFIMEKFWNKFNETFLTADVTLERIIIPPKLVGRECPLCKNELIYKKTRKKLNNYDSGEFIGCSSFPECNFTEKIIIKKNRWEKLAKLRKPE